jgi:hypothetical protein
MFSKVISNAEEIVRLREGREPTTLEVADELIEIFNEALA